MSRIVQIVPVLPPAFSGVGDYAIQVARHWPDSNVEWCWLVRHQSDLPTVNAKKGTIATFERHYESLQQELIRANARTVIIHYVPHGFDDNGIPAYLVKALSRFKRSSGCTVLTVFHELYATGPFWSKSGLLSVHAKNICSKIVKLSDGWITSTERYLNLACNMTNSKVPCRLLSVGPTIVLEQPTHNAKTQGPRNTQLNIVVFGSGPNRLKSLTLHSQLINDLEKSNRAAKLLIVGSTGNESYRRQEELMLSRIPASISVERLIDASSAEVSEVLSSGDIALVATEKELAGKSSAVATCVAHNLKCVFPGQSLLDAGTVQRNMSWPTWSEIAGAVYAMC